MKPQTLVKATDAPLPGRCGRPAFGAGQRGFTIIELVIAILIVGVLTALVFPSMMDSIRKGRRTEAFGKLNAVQLAQERWRSNNAAYSAVLSNAWDAAPPGLGIPATTTDGRYSITLVGAPTATTHTVLATAISGTSQVDDSNCAQLGVRITDGNIEYGSAAAGGALSYAAGNRCWAR